jgi:hypothetical protein
LSSDTRHVSGHPADAPEKTHAVSPVGVIRPGANKGRHAEKGKSRMTAPWDGLATGKDVGLADECCVRQPSQPVAAVGPHPINWNNGVLIKKQGKRSMEIYEMARFYNFCQKRVGSEGGAGLGVPPTSVRRAFSLFGDAPSAFSFASGGAVQNQFQKNLLLRTIMAD